MKDRRRRRKHVRAKLGVDAVGADHHIGFGGDAVREMHARDVARTMRPWTQLRHGAQVALLRGREINDKARVSPPHDHGASWAIYGQATLWTDMIEWKREDNGTDPKHAKLAPEKKYRLEPGHAGIYQDGKIHSIDYPDKSRFVRVTGVNLDNINRIRIDLKTGEVHQMTPQQAT